MPSLLLLNVDGCDNGIGTGACVRLFEAVRRHGRLETLRLHAGVGTLAREATVALASLAIWLVVMAARSSVSIAPTWVDARALSWALVSALTCAVVKLSI